MVYKVYGILSSNGTNTLIGKAYSFKQAMKLVRYDMNENCYPVFAITEHQRVGSIPLGISYGRTSQGLCLTTHSLVARNAINPIENEKDGRCLLMKTKLFNQ